MMSLGIRPGERETKAAGVFAVRPVARRIRRKKRFQNHFAALRGGEGWSTAFLLEFHPSLK
jgi:hypothetical protein